MTRTQKIMSTAALAACGTSASIVVAETVKDEEAQESVAAHLAVLDARLFKAAFEDCDMSVLEKLLDEDLEFYHDRDGLSYTTGKSFIADVAKDCASGSAGGKRVLVPDSMTTHMIGDFGAMQMGRHEFHEIVPNAPSIAREKGVFIHMWKRTPEKDDGWQITRIISYDHEGIE